ncbi:MAG TPA: helix-turn-helix transcriptional regulator [Chloroflexota bacterium]|jgi:predicted XRE-type DNA-binding protein
MDALGIEASSGNVFADLGFEQPDLELAKAQLSNKIAAELATRKLTQRAAAVLLGIDQPRVSLLIRGKTGQFSLEKLIELLGCLGFDVRIEATQSVDAARGKVLVSA